MARAANADAGTLHSGINDADQLADADERINCSWMQKARSVIGSITGASMVLVMVSAAAVRRRASRGCLGTFHWRGGHPLRTTIQQRPRLER